MIGDKLTSESVLGHFGGLLGTMIVTFMANRWLKASLMISVHSTYVQDHSISDIVGKNQENDLLASISYLLVSFLEF